MKNSKENRRSKVLVATEIQGRLAIRCVFYWFLGMSAIFLFVALSKLFFGESQSVGAVFVEIWQQNAVAVLASAVLLPLVVWDIVRFSHRVVGPLQRLEERLEKFADGEVGRPVRFRDSDFWHSLAEQYNRAIVNRGQVVVQQEAEENSAAESQPVEV